MADSNDTRKSKAKSVATNPRQDRLRRALRENLKRRKVQARRRSQDVDAAGDTTDDGVVRKD